MNANGKETATRKHDALLEQVCAYAREHMGEKITLKDVAQNCGVSVSTITQLFRKTVNDTFHGYLTRLRMERAEELICNGVSLEEVGRQVGYLDHSSFYRAFCRNFGKSPREHKRSLTRK